MYHNTTRKKVETRQPRNIQSSDISDFPREKIENLRGTKT